MVARWTRPILVNAIFRHGIVFFLYILMIFFIRKRKLMIRCTSLIKIITYLGSDWCYEPIKNKEKKRKKEGHGEKNKHS